ncbi:unnamed protein product [marine sediment metagenome]|uniref:Uncharacterized protein n=1 Tax=marine sediment metagenome TaxID=412755 RepID=X0SCE5_9ZZZZ
MAVKLELKKRRTQGNVTLSLEWIKAIINRGDAANQLLSQVKGMVDGSIGVHDKKWLTEIINWAPQGGLPLTETAKWFKLAKRVADLDEEEEGFFTLSDYQVTLVWSRLIDPEYKVTGLPSAFVEFIMGFQQASGRHFPEEEPDEVKGSEEGSDEIEETD